MKPHTRKTFVAIALAVALNASAISGQRNSKTGDPGQAKK